MTEISRSLADRCAAVSFAGHRCVWPLAHGGAHTWEDGPHVGCEERACECITTERDRLRAENERLKAPEGWEDELNAAWAIVNKVRAENERLREALTDIADHHHRTLVGSKLHDPEHVDLADCPALSCSRARSALASDETLQRPEEGS